MGNRSKSDLEVPRNQIHTPHHLYDELLGMANVNQPFRFGKSAHYSVKTYEEEATELTDMLDYEDDGRWPTPVIGEEYEFSVRRVPRKIGQTVQSAIYFEYYYEISLQNITLPDHIAEESFGINPEDIDDGQDSTLHPAVAEAGPSTLEHRVTIGIDSIDKELSLCESYTYKDYDDDAVIHSCSCPIPHTDSVGFSNIIHKTNAWVRANNGGETDDDDYDEDDDEDTQYGAFSLKNSTQFNSEAARKLDVIDDLTDDELIEMMRLDITMQEDKALADLILAQSIMRSMKHTFKRQLGMRFPTARSKK
jgi:hypothetical protein